MEQGHAVGVFTKVLIKLAGLQHTMENRLFAQLLQEKTSLLISAYLVAERAPSPSVAQYTGIRDILHVTDGTLDVVRIAANLKLTSAAPLLETIRVLLEFKLNMRSWEQECSLRLSESSKKKEESARS